MSLKPSPRSWGQFEEITVSTVKEEMSPAERSAQAFGIIHKMNMISMARGESVTLPPIVEDEDVERPIRVEMPVGLVETMVRRRLAALERRLGHHREQWAEISAATVSSDPRITTSQQVQYVLKRERARLSVIVESLECEILRLHQEVSMLRDGFEKIGHEKPF